jgi:hypothetical protein
MSGDVDSMERQEAGTRWLDVFDAFLRLTRSSGSRDARVTAQAHVPLLALMPRRPEPNVRRVDEVTW